MQMARPTKLRGKKVQVRAAADELRRIVQALRVSSAAIENQCGLSGAQLFALPHLSSERGMSISELAIRTRTDPSSVSVVVSRLAKRGLVVRTTSPLDARCAELRLSADG